MPSGGAGQVPSEAGTAADRLLSLDLLRGLVVLLMLFVNQADSVEGASAFLRHAGEDADTVTLADLVLPAFLFMVGMSVPFALGPRFRRDGFPATLRHVAARGLALLVMGVLMVNADLARADGPLSPEAWGALAVVAALLVWQAPPRQAGLRPAWRSARGIGLVLMVLLVVVYHGSEASGLVQVRPHWWGILGIIGWAYLTASLLYLLVGERPALLLALVAALNGLYYLAAWLPPAGWLSSIGLGSLAGSQGAVALSGTLLGVMVVRHLREGASSPRRPRPLPGWPSSPPRTAPAGAAGRRSCASPGRTRSSPTCWSRWCWRCSPPAPRSSAAIPGAGWWAVPPRRGCWRRCSSPVCWGTWPACWRGLGCDFDCDDPI